MQMKSDLFSQLLRKHRETALRAATGGIVETKCKGRPSMVHGRALSRRAPTNFQLATPRELLSCFIAVTFKLSFFVSPLRSLSSPSLILRVSNDLKDRQDYRPAARKVRYHTLLCPPIQR